jgi:hypothetical protein
LHFASQGEVTLSLATISAKRGPRAERSDRAAVPLDRFQRHPDLALSLGEREAGVGFITQDSSF